MEGRDYDFGVWGFADTAFTEYGKDVILNKNILPLLGKDDYYGAFTAYLDKTEEIFLSASEGVPFDRGNDPAERTKDFIIRFVSVILISLAGSLGICLYWRSKMKTAKPAQKANKYIPEGGFVLTKKQDQFLYRTETRTKIETSSSSSGSVRSGGGSHRSGKF